METVAKRSQSVPRDGSAATEAMSSDTHNPGATDLASPSSPLSTYSSAADTNQDEVSPLPLGLEVSHSSPLLAGEQSGLAPTQLRRRNLQPRNTAPPAQPYTCLASRDENPASHRQFVQLESGSGVSQTCLGHTESSEWSFCNTTNHTISHG